MTIQAPRPLPRSPFHDMAKMAVREREIREVCFWAERNFRVKETGEPIVLAPFQRAVLKFALQRNRDGHPRWKTVTWSQPKKSGKTTTSGIVAEWAAETWGPYQEILCVGNDAMQARERAFKAVLESVELNPGYNRLRRELPRRWRVLDDKLRNLQNGSLIRAIATDYTGEAGGNPSLMVFTELWGFIHKDALRFWAEMAPSPTRPISMRWVETYAGFEGESELLWGLYRGTVIEGRQLTAAELAMGDPALLGCFEEAPNPEDKVPCWVDEAAGMFTFWDSGTRARRMPWQRGANGEAYYANEAKNQTPSQMTRLHSNEWVSAESNFVPIEWWYACKNPLEIKPGDKTPMILAIDAGVTNDNFGLIGVTRDPRVKETDASKAHVAVRIVRVWKAPKGGSIDFGAASGPEETIKKLCQDYNIVEIAYDPYQLHDMSTRMLRNHIGWFRAFDQGQDRRKADRLLYDLIAQRRLAQPGEADLDEHIKNCNGKVSKEDDSKLKLVKKSENRHIDLAVCLAMAAAECLRLNL